MIQEEEISFDEIEEILKKRNLEFFKDEIYIMPEASEENSDILNEYTPDIHKFLKLHGIKSIIVKNILLNYDEIIVMKDGMVIEKGSFDYLISLKGYFYSLYYLQNEDI